MDSTCSSTNINDLNTLNPSIPPPPTPTPNTGGQWNFLKMFCVFKAEEKKLYNCYLDLIDNSRICWSNHETVKRMEEVI